MTYRTKASEDLVDTIQCRLSRLEHNLTLDMTPMKRAVEMAWLDATKAALHDIYLALEKIETEAATVPENEETVNSVDEWLRREGFSDEYIDWLGAA